MIPNISTGMIAAIRLVGNAISLVQFVAIPAMSAFPVFFKELLKGKAHGANLSDSCSIFLRRLFRAGDNVLVNSLSVIVLSCIAMRRNTLHHGADGDYSGSLVLRRWSSSRATVTSCPISSAALIPSFSTCASASCEEIRGFLRFLLPGGGRFHRAWRLL